MNKITIVAEVGCNHMGDMTRAKMLIRSAAACGADIVKFQKRENRLLLTPEEYDAPHPVPKNSYGPTYGAHREFLEFTLLQHKELIEECEKFDIEYCTSVWERHSAWGISQLDGVKHIKIPSACNLDWDIYKELAAFEGTLHVSLGMTTIDEFEQIDKVLWDMQKENKELKVVMYACTSGYPVEAEESYLYDINSLNEEGYHPVGYSGHHLGIAIDLAAIGAGATYLERHFTLDRLAKGTDHFASLDVQGLMHLIELVRSVEPALQAKWKMPEVELVQREKLKRKATLK